MPSTIELILFFLYFLITSAIIGVLDTKYTRKVEKSEWLNRNRVMRYSSAVYWFRDYWSNRLGLKRNVQDEDFRIDSSSRTVGELIVEKRDNERCDVQGFGSRFEDLVDPYKVVRQYEPYSVVVRESLGEGILMQLPEKRYEEDTAHTQTHVPDEVNVVPVVRSKSLFSQPLELLLIGVLIVWFGSIISRYLIAFIPWLAPMYIPMVVLFLVAYLCIGAIELISEATTEVKEADATIYLYSGKHPSQFHYRHAEDVPDWLEAKPYWVFRYLLQWSGELTIKKRFPFICFPKDVERVETWLDARTGVVEWIVSDYHWRELWYKTEPNLRSIRVWILPNFHTPRPLNIKTEGKGELKELYTWGKPLNEAWESHVEKHTIFHPGDWITGQLGSKYSVIASELSKLWWDKWRYPQGADSDLYRNENPTVGEQPPIPRPGRVLGVVIKWLTPFDDYIYLVDCEDGHERICETKKMPRFMGMVLVAKGDPVLVSLADSQSETKGDIIWRYDKRQTELLRKDTTTSTFKQTKLFSTS